MISKNHKKFFSIFFDFISENFDYFHNNLNIGGFYFLVKGKISLSGNAKKKKSSIKKGFIKVSSNYSKIDLKKFNIKTDCGSFGITIILNYK